MRSGCTDDLYASATCEDLACEDDLPYVASNMIQCPQLAVFDLTATFICKKPAEGWARLVWFYLVYLHVDLQLIQVFIGLFACVDAFMLHTPPVNDTEYLVRNSASFVSCAEAVAMCANVGARLSSAVTLDHLNSNAAIQ